MVRIAGDSAVFQGYQSGYLNNNCCWLLKKTINHAVVAVGYGIMSGTPHAYFIMKNSWGTTWGEQGYIKIMMTSTGDGICGNQRNGYEVTMQTVTNPNQI